LDRSQDASKRKAPRKEGGSTYNTGKNYRAAPGSQGPKGGKPKRDERNRLFGGDAMREKGIGDPVLNDGKIWKGGGPRRVEGVSKI